MCVRLVRLVWCRFCGCGFVLVLVIRLMSWFKVCGVSIVLLLMLIELLSIIWIVLSVVLLCFR